jgi:hypothetical protein
MIWSLIGIFLTIIIVGILKDTHCVCYDGLKAEEEFDIKIPLWLLIIILLIELIPFFNIVLFIAFIIWYIVKSCGEPDRFYDKCLFSLRGETYVGQVLVIIKNFLNIKV